MREWLKIGEVARLIGVTTKTVRQYEKVGLLGAPQRLASKLANALAKRRTSSHRRWPDYERGRTADGGAAPKVGEEPFLKRVYPRNLLR